jgi:hypothetical protein
VSCRVVMLVLPHVGGELRVHNPAERHNPKGQESDHSLLNSTGHNPNAASHFSLQPECLGLKFSSKSGCLYGLLFLNPCDNFFDLLLGQQPALDIFLHAPFLIDEDAHR